MTPDGTPHEKVLILDYGGQTSQLIARRVREHSVWCELVSCTVPVEEIRAAAPKGLILSGGPDSVYRPGAPTFDPGIASLGIPILGICYGMQVLVKSLGGRVESSTGREFGRAEFYPEPSNPLFEKLPPSHQVWMSHGDTIEELPEGFRVAGRTESTPCAAMLDSKRGIFGILFHPEVAHTRHGKEILGNFLFRVCGLHGDWKVDSLVSETVHRIRAQVGDGKVVLGISGGVDSTVAAVLIHRAIGNRLFPIFVNTGLLRAGEVTEVEELLNRDLGLSLLRVDGEEAFLSGLKGVENPEEKRKVIGRIFVELFEREARRIGDVEFLAQGTLYPDLIESQPFAGPSQVIKTHHNVGGLPTGMALKLVEPLREFFKDEVRRLGAALEIPAGLLERHPFPGPGLAVRVIGEVTRERLNLLRAADTLFISELRKEGLYSKVSQALAVLLPVKSVGVMGDGRTYENVCALRAVTTEDFMTADWARLPSDFLARVSSRIVNEVRGINRVVYDISSKPPSTIEWE